MTSHRISCSLRGAGPALVLVHGITESRHTWDPLIADLALDHLVLSVDLRGHGESSEGENYDPLALAGDVYRAVSTLATRYPSLRSPLLVGHSLGGVVVSAYAAAFECRGVVNIDQPLRLAAFQDQLRSVEPLLRGDQASFQGFISAMFSAMDGPLPEAERQRILRFRNPKQQVVLSIWSAVLESTVEELDSTVDALASAITVPYLSLHGIDPGPEYPGWLTSRIPTATVEVWPEHGHYPHLVDAGRFTARLREFERALRD